MSKILGICGILLVWAYFQVSSGSGNGLSQQSLSVSEDKERVVLAWSGPVQEPMSERIAAALERYRADPRLLVLLLNSPGGSIEHGRKVVAVMRARKRPVNTLVQKAGVCASMCVPIYLSGTQRMADPEARFMFHEASLSGSVTQRINRQQLSDDDRARFKQAVKRFESNATDELFNEDIGIRGVNMAWTEKMRGKIAGRHDIWMSGQQLMDEGSGVVDRLVRTAAR
jgi:ATP-dependent protease ClpP protease subunit